MSKQKMHRDIKARIEFTKEILNNEELMKQAGIMVKRNGKPVATKIQDILYPRIINAIDDGLIKKVPKIAIEKMQSIGCNKEYKSAIVFIIPNNSAMVLSSGDYIAVRPSNDKKEIMFNDIINLNLDFTYEKHNQYYGAAAFICGIISTKPFSTFYQNKIFVQDAYRNILEYINDFITAYRLIRHDHNISQLTSMTLPSEIKFAVINIKNDEINKNTFISNHVHDLMDSAAKLALPNYAYAYDIQFFCENLPIIAKNIQYILKLMLDSINSFCMGDYATCITLSDLFMEYSTKIIWTKIPSLKKKDIPQRIFKKGDDNTVIGLISKELDIKGDALIGKWLKKSREVRNELVHKTNYYSIDQNAAFNAMKYNFEIIALFIDRLNLQKDDLTILLKLGNKTFHRLFEV